MNVSYAWLQTYLPEISATAEEAADTLTMLGLEVDSVVPVAHAFTKVVVGQIVAIEPHPDADRLKLCQVQIGTAEPLAIVCGAPNARLDLKVAVAQVGARLGAQQDFKIKKSKIRGQVSLGMLCSAAELGLSDSSNGILELAEDAICGSDLRDYLNLDDQILEVDLTPNRGDCASVLGLARELAAAYNIALQHVPEPVVTPSLSDQVAVKVKEPSAAPCFLTQVVRASNFNQPLPDLWQQRLIRAGLRAVNPVVDILNLVMLEIGTPLHAYDAAKLQGDLQVAYAQDGQQATLLDGKQYTLSATDLVVQDERNVQALAGIMGAQTAEVSAETKELVLEAAYFAPMGIARSARAHGISTDSAYRFERGVDFAMQQTALARVLSMLQQIAPDLEAGPLVKVCSESDVPVRQPVLLRKLQIPRILGFKLADAEVERILVNLGLQLQACTDGWQVTVPSWRFDLQLEVDMLEELLRGYGYKNLPTTTLSWPQQIKPPQTATMARAYLRQRLCEHGFNEIRSYSFISNELNKLFNPQHEPKLVANPLAQEQAAMRTSLWPGLVQAAQFNLNRQHKQVRLFEMATCFIPQADGSYQQQLHLAGLVVGSRLPQQWSAEDQNVDFYDLKAVVEMLLDRYFPVHERLKLPLSYACFSPLKDDASARALQTVLHPGQAACINYAHHNLGYIGKVHPQLADKLGLSEGAADMFLFELNLDALPEPQMMSYQTKSRLPSMRRDLALLLPREVTARSLVAAIGEFAVKHLPEVELTMVPFDQYQGEHVAQGQKSLALSLTFQATSRTLVDEEINMFIQQLVDSLQGSIGVRLRGI